MMVGVDFTGKTLEEMGSERRMEPLLVSTMVTPQYTVYSIHLGTVYLNTQEKNDLEHLVSHAGEELKISLWVDGEQMKLLN